MPLWKMLLLSWNSVRSTHSGGLKNVPICMGSFLFISSWATSEAWLMLLDTGCSKKIENCTYFWSIFTFFQKSQNRQFCFAIFSMKIVSTEKTEYTTTIFGKHFHRFSFFWKNSKQAILFRNFLHEKCVDRKKGVHHGDERGKRKKIAVSDFSFSKLCHRDFCKTFS